MGFVNYDRYSEITPLRALVNTTIGSNTTTTGAVVDTGAPGAATQAKMVTFVLAFGAITDGSYALQVFEDDVVGMGTETQVAASRVFAAATTFTSTDTLGVKAFSVKHNKRFLRLKLVSTSVTTGAANVQAAALLERY